MTMMNKNDVAGWVRKKASTTLLMVLQITFRGFCSDIFRVSPTGDLTPVDGAAVSEKTAALKQFADSVGGILTENVDKRNRVENVMKTPGEMLRQAYFAYQQSDKKINQTIQVEENLEISAAQIDKAFTENAEETFSKYTKQILEFCEEHSLLDEAGFGILLTGECAKMPPIEYSVRKIFTISPFMQSPVLDMYGGVECDIRDRKELRRSMAGTQRLSVNSKGIFYITEDGYVNAISYGSDIYPTKASSLSAGEHHVVFLTEDGVCKAIGDNDMGQCSLKGIKDAVSAYAASDTSYLVHRDGTVSAHGTTPLGQEIGTWTNIKKLAGNRGFVVGLRKDGSVVCAKERWLKNSFREIGEWNNITDVVAASGCIAALKKDGTVVCSCMDAADKRNTCILFKDIVSIAADSRYIYGLTGEGKVLLAGGGSELTDMGRSGASKWSGVLAIAAGNACVAGILDDGRVKFAGNIILPPGGDDTFAQNNMSGTLRGST